MYTCTLGGMSCLEREAAKRGRKRRKLASKASLVNDGVSLVVEQATRVVACPFPFRTIGATVSKKHTGDFVIAVASAMLISGKWWVPIGGSLDSWCRGCLHTSLGRSGERVEPL